MVYKDNTVSCAVHPLEYFGEFELRDIASLEQVEDLWRLCTYLVITNQLDSFLTEFPVLPIFLGIIDHLQTPPFELEV